MFGEGLKMKKLMGVLVCLIALSFGSANANSVSPHNSNTTIPNAEWIMYENSKFDFQIKYPEKWSVQEGFMGTAVVFVCPPENNNAKFCKNVNIVVEDLSAYPGMTLEKYHDIFLEQAKIMITDFKHVASGNIVISGIPGKTVVFTGRQGVMPLEYLQIYIIANKKVYIYTFTDDEVSYNSNEKLAMQIANSIQIN
jgi:hypothetical protein